MSIKRINYLHKLYINYSDRLNLTLFVSKKDHTLFILFQILKAYLGPNQKTGRCNKGEERRIMRGSSPNNRSSW